MGLSIQTNVTSLIAQQNLRANTAFQSNTIQQLTSGYRINSSGDDAAGLAVANKYRSDTAELTQGVRNANDGISAFQTIDGGLSNISTIVDRLRTLATQSASTTFTGDRNTLNNEYQSLVTEIDRQASNVGLNTGGKYNTNIGVYIGGGSTQGNAGVSVDLSGASNAVDTSALGLAKTTITAGGTALGATNVVLLNAPGALFVAGGAQSFTFNTTTSTGAASTLTATVNGGTNGISSSQVIQSLNNQLQASGISASVGSNGKLDFASSSAFSLDTVVAGSGVGDIATGGSLINANAGLNTITTTGFSGITGTNEAITFQNGATSYNVSLSATGGSVIQQLNSQLAGSGISAVLAANGTDVSIQSQNGFSVNETAAATTGLFTATGVQTVVAPLASASSSVNANSALAAISAAVTSIGLVQGHIGAGENLLADAVSLAQSQITNLSAAQSRIRDADIATEAANLTKGQVLQQSSIAALAQANSAPQQLLTLLKG